MSSLDLGDVERLLRTEQLKKIFTNIIGWSKCNEESRHDSFQLPN